MSRRKSIVLRVFFGAMLLLCLGSKPACDTDPPTLTCDTVSVSLNPGECVEFQNSCGNHQWERLDGFRLCDPPSDLFIQTQRDPQARFLCANSNISHLTDEPVDYFYARPNETGTGQFRITIGSNPLTVSSSATPTNIPVGGTSQLNAIVSGGTPPYAYAWTPAGSLNDATIANPLARPSVTTQYTVVVTDSIGTTMNSSVIVNVGLSATATAAPAVIAAGGQSQLDVQTAGGAPPYSYAWTPATSLNNPNIQSPVAMPTQTTQYNVTVNDALGNTAVSSVTVRVLPSLLQACFTVPQRGAVFIDLDGSCSSGPPIVTYRWWCDFVGGAQAPSGESATPAFRCLYETPGVRQVRLEVLDANGSTSVITQTVPHP